MIDSSTVLRRASDVRYRLLGDEAVVLAQRRGEAMGLSEVGGRFLDLCDGERTFGEIVDRMEREYDADRATVESDLARFAEELLASGVLERPGEPVEDGV